MSRPKLLKGEALRAAARKRLEEASGREEVRRSYRLPTSLLDFDAEESPGDDGRDEDGAFETGAEGFDWGTREAKVSERVIAVVDSEDLDDGEEIKLLCRTLGLECVEVVSLPRTHRIEAATYLAPGMLGKLAERLRGRQATAVVVDADISPAQARNIEDAVKAPVLDREGVILSIFSLHARSKLAKLQVELAHLKYLQPRLAGQWMGLSRQRGARGGLGGRGVGETRLELDRRVVKERISVLTRKLKEAEKSLRTQSRRRRDLRRVALVGYTNAGKSTLMRRLSGSDVLVENKLFSTLDTTVRGLVPPTRPEILVSDTVGFVRKLPPGLVASFKSTLEEAVTSGLILHVLDISRPQWRDHFEATELVLEEIGCAGIPRLLVLNKVDQLDFPLKVRSGQVARFVKAYPDYRATVAVSALEGDGVAELRTAIMEALGAEEPEWRRSFEGEVEDDGT